MTISYRNVDVWRKVLDLVEKHSDPNQAVISCAEHDQVWINLGVEEVPEDSEDGKFLDENNFFIDGDGWSCFT